MTLTRLVRGLRSDSISRELLYMLPWPTTEEGERGERRGGEGGGRGEGKIMSCE